MPPDFSFPLSPDRLAQAVVVFAAASVVLLLALFIHTAASDWLQISRAQKRARRLERRLENQANQG